MIDTMTFLMDLDTVQRYKLNLHYSITAITCKPSLESSNKLELNSLWRMMIDLGSRTDNFMTRNYSSQRREKTKMDTKGSFLTKPRIEGLYIFFSQRVHDKGRIRAQDLMISY